MFCVNCGRELPGIGDYCPYCGARIVVGAEKGKEPGLAEKQNIDDNCPEVQIGKRKRKKVASPKPKKHLKGINVALIILISSAVVFGSVFGAIYVSKMSSLEEQYAILIDSMSNVDPSNYSLIGENLDAFPLTYKDIKKLKSEYAVVKECIEIILLNSALSRDEEKSEEMRTAFAQLVDLSNENANWDFSKYLEGDILVNSFGKLVYGKQWKYASYHFYWGDQGFSSNLPKKLDSSKEYYYHTDKRVNPHKFGYTNTRLPGDKYDAYQIVSVAYDEGRWEIRIYCISEKKAFTLI